ncbi:MAG: PilN domain-containing protein [Acetobacterium sp.]
MKSEINLLPIQPRKKKSHRFLTENPWLKLALPLLIVFLFSYGLLSFMNQACLNQIKQIEAVINNQNGFQIPYENLLTENELIAHREKMLEVLNQNSDVTLGILVGVQDVLPLGINLVDFQFKGNKILLTGKTQNQHDILLFRENLMALNLFRSVNIQNTTKIQKLADTEIIGDSISGDSWDFMFAIEVLGVTES